MRTTRFILAGAMVLLSAAGLSWGQAMQPMDTAPSFVGSKIVTELSGDQEIGSIATRAVGKAYFDVRSDGALHFKIDVNRISGVTGVYIQQGQAGQIGPVIARLYVPAQPTGFLTGTLVEGTVTAASLVGPFEGRNVSDLVNQMMNNNAYINIATAINAGGELRGNIPYPYH